MTLFSKLTRPSLVLVLLLSGCATTPDDAGILNSLKTADKLPIAQLDRGVMIWLPSQVSTSFTPPARPSWLCVSVTPTTGHGLSSLLISVPTNHSLTTQE